MMKKAASLLELLAVLSIIALVAAIVYPVFGQAKAEAKKTSCISNMRQISMATSIYRTQNGGDGIYGSMYAMALPTFEGSLQNEAFWKPLRQIGSCDGAARPPDHVHGGISYFYAPTPPGTSGAATDWESYASEKQDSSVLLFDMYHNPAGTMLSSPFTTKYGVAITIGGYLIKRRKPGSAFYYYWWH